MSEETGEADEDAVAESCVPLMYTPLDGSCRRRFMHGLKLAVKDPKSWIFAVKTYALLLGFSFINFFPT